MQSLGEPTPRPQICVNNLPPAPPPGFCAYYCNLYSHDFCDLAHYKRNHLVYYDLKIVLY